MFSCQKVVLRVTLSWSGLTPIVRLHFSHFRTFSHACLFITIAISASLATTHRGLNSNKIGMTL